MSQPATTDRTESLSLPSDEQLMQLVAQGQASAYHLLVERYLGKIVSLGRRRGLSATDAEDLAQDVFLTLWQKPHYFNASKSKFNTWIYRITINRSIDRARRLSVRKASSIEEMQQAGKDILIDPAPLAFDIINSSQRKQILEKALQHLTLQQQTALHLAYGQQMTGREGAQIMGTTLKAYEALLVRARHKLKALLTPLQTAEQAMANTHPHEAAYARSR